MGRQTPARRPALALGARRSADTSWQAPGCFRRRRGFILRRLSLPRRPESGPSVGSDSNPRSVSGSALATRLQADHTGLSAPPRKTRHRLLSAAALAVDPVRSECRRAASPASRRSLAARSPLQEKCSPATSGGAAAAIYSRARPALLMVHVAIRQRWCYTRQRAARRTSAACPGGVKLLRPVTRDTAPDR